MEKIKLEFPEIAIPIKGAYSVQNNSIITPLEEYEMMKEEARAEMRQFALDKWQIREELRNVLVCEETQANSEKIR